MVSTTVLIAAIGVIAVAILVIRSILWRLVRTAAVLLPDVVPRLAGSRLWLRAGPWRTHASTHYPRTYRALAARFGTTRFSGLPLTLMTIGALYALAALGGLVDEVRENAGRIALDQSIDVSLSPYRAAWLLDAFLWITAISAGPALAAVLCAATALLWSSGRGRLIAPLWIAFAGAQATTWSGKYIIARPRPVFLPDITEWNPSFPSGHATASTALIGMLGLIVATGAATLRARFEVAFVTLVIIALVCFSRLFLGVHFFTDVVAGVLVGIFWLLVGASVAWLWPRQVATPVAAPVVGLRAEDEDSGRAV